VWNEPLWAKVSAVKNKRVYLSPVYPFGWIDRRPSINRLIDLKWMAHLIHPELFPLDHALETRAFYELF
jgi:iron complex transport system substrate-binding protein